MAEDRMQNIITGAMVKNFEEKTLIFWENWKFLGNIKFFPFLDS